MAGRSPTFLTFPDPVNETAARLVAGGVAVIAWVAVGFDLPWLAVVLAYGFVARVLSGPRLSPLGLVATRVLAPRLPSRLVPGPPKRFAQGIGAALSLGATAAWALGQPTVARVLLAAIAVAATLEAALGLCLGCKVFGLLMRVGVIPESVCEACARLDHTRPSST